LRNLEEDCYRGRRSQHPRRDGRRIADFKWVGHGWGTSGCELACGGSSRRVPRGRGLRPASGGGLWALCPGALLGWRRPQAIPFGTAVGRPALL